MRTIRGILDDLLLGSISKMEAISLLKEHIRLAALSEKEPTVKRGMKWEHWQKASWIAATLGWSFYLIYLIIKG